MNQVFTGIDALVDNEETLRWSASFDPRSGHGEQQTRAGTSIDRTRRSGAGRIVFFIEIMNWFLNLGIISTGRTESIGKRNRYHSLAFTVQETLRSLSRMVSHRNLFDSFGDWNQNSKSKSILGQPSICVIMAWPSRWAIWPVITTPITKWWCQFYLIRFVFVSLLLHSFDFPRFVEVPGLLFGMYFMDKAGRRMTVSGSMMLSGIACLSAGLSPAGELINTFPVCLRKPPRCYQTTSHNITQPTLSTIWRIWFTVMEFGIDPGAYRTVLFLLGKLFISCCFAGIYSFTSELFPTAARSAAMGLCSTSGRIGGIAAPIIADLVSV